ncbi:MAG: methyl-accepting chemotaxis protein [Elusimicrobia bacterium]|nr:methyl-accepting chemotaxis protein [Elusimicrobiota bacterium]
MTPAQPTPPPSQYQRRTVLVKKSLQIRYIALILISALAITLIASGDTFYTMYKIALLDNPALEPLLSQIQSMILVKLILFFGIISLVSIFFSHRLAGPIYRFEKSTQVVGAGDLTHRVSLRTGDELLELQEEFNAMVTNLQLLVQKDRTLARRLGGKITQFIQNHPAGEAQAGLREELLSLKSELEHITAGFRV